MILTKQQADVIGALLSDSGLVLGRKKNIGSRVVFDSKSGVPLLVTSESSKKQVPMAVHGRVVNDMVEKSLLKLDKQGNHVLTDSASSINKEDLKDYTANGKPRVTEDGICKMAAKYGYNFEFQRVVGIAMFTKDGDAVVETSIRIDRLSDMSITEWEEHLYKYIKSL